MKYMLDTNIIIFLMKNKSETVVQKFQSVPQDEVCVSSITYAELEYGVSKSTNKQKNTFGFFDHDVKGKGITV